MSEDVESELAGVGASPSWRKATFSNDVACVEVADLGNRRIGVRDSKDPSGETLVLADEEFAAWIQQIKTGTYDYLMQVL
jgi:hypothetical protein